MKVFAIGATGFIGKHVVDYLLRLGHAVTILHRGKTNPVLPDRVEQVFGHRDRLSAAVDDLRRFGPEVVLDMILYTERQANELVNLLRRMADRLGLSFEYADDYDKILVERVVMGQPDLPATVLRLPAVYGPGDKGHRVHPYLRRMADGRPAILLADEHARWRWTKGYVENVAAAVALAVTRGRAAGRIYNVGENPTPTEREWVDRIGAAAAWQGKVVSVPADELPSHLQPRHDWRYDLQTSTVRIRKELGYAEPVSPEDAWERTLAWERSHLHEADQPEYAAEDAVLRTRQAL